MKQIPAPLWILAGFGVALWFARRKIADTAKAAAALPAKAGEALSAKAFDLLNPGLRAENYNVPTIVDPDVKGPTGKCPPGYTLKYGRARGWYCLRNA